MRLTSKYSNPEKSRRERGEQRCGKQTFRFLISDGWRSTVDVEVILDRYDKKESAKIRLQTQMTKHQLEGHIGKSYEQIILNQCMRMIKKDFSGWYVDPHDNPNGIRI